MAFCFVYEYPGLHYVIGSNHLIYFLALCYAEIESSPVRCLVSEVKYTTCGGDFTVWLSSIEGASILYGFWMKIAFSNFDSPSAFMNFLFLLRTH